MKHNHLEIREATLEELDLLNSFEQALIAHERKFAPNLREGEIQYYDIKALIESPDADVLVALVDGVVVGSGYLEVTSSAEYKKPEKYAYLGFMYVLPAYRGQGIIVRLIEDLMERGKKRKLTEFQLDVYAHNQMAINAYEKLGFKPDLLKMRVNTEGP